MRTETEDLADRFSRVLDESFKRLAKQQKHLPLPIHKHLNANQIRAMHLLHTHPGMAQKDLAEAMGITPAAISTAVKEMTSLGLIDRKSDPDDARQMRLYLSEQAQCQISEIQIMRSKAVARLLAALPLEEQRMIVEALERAIMQSPQEETGPP